ncbi:MAG TPA: hypothetical protein VEW67_09430 [Thermoleophilaceae bacterium]|nr:hypothetical protein [Thermoleophilaceae bacterium]
MAVVGGACRVAVRVCALGAVIGFCVVGCGGSGDARTHSSRDAPGKGVAMAKGESRFDSPRKRAIAALIESQDDALRRGDFGEYCAGTTRRLARRLAAYEPGVTCAESLRARIPVYAESASTNSDRVRIDWIRINKPPRQSRASASLRAVDGAERLLFFANRTGTWKLDRRWPHSGR